MNSDGTDQPIVIGRSTAGWLGSMVATVFIGAIALGMLIVAVLVLLNGAQLGILFLVVAVILGILFANLLRDTRGKTGWRIVIGTDALDLDLPLGRSLIHRLDAVHAPIRFDEIEAIETRLEAYPGLFGLTDMHRSYGLKLKTGAVIILGEDRALHTTFESSLLEGAVRQIVGRSRLELRDLGMAEGRDGLLGVLFAAPPPWDAPSLSAERQGELWAAAERTGSLALGAIFVSLFNRPK